MISVDHDAARRIADGWASNLRLYPPAGELARAYLDLLNQYGPRLDSEEPHRRHLREMRATTGGEP